ncbi:MAG: heme o synthase [Pseudomonadota bacterium]|nr:heme o synthase [Pseudomonadota bacterium]
MRDYLVLTKPVIVLLILVTAIPAVLMASREQLDVIVLIAAALGVMLAAASASVFNHLLEADLDQRMYRTRSRPLARGTISKSAACMFATALGIASVLMLLWQTTLVAALLAVVAILFYALLYTLVLKPNTPQNIVIGGAAGAVGPLIGWAAVTGGLSWSAWLLFLLIFLWTPPHFWALAIHYRRDYKHADVPMYPTVHGVAKTKRMIFLYVLAILPVLLCFNLVSDTSQWFFAISMVVSLYFLYKSWSFLRSNKQNDLSLFHFSCIYVLLLFSGISIDQLLMVWLQ